MNTSEIRKKLLNFVDGLTAELHGFDVEVNKLYDEIKKENNIITNNKMRIDALCYSAPPPQLLQLTLLGLRNYFYAIDKNNFRIEDKAVIHLYCSKYYEYIEYLKSDYWKNLISEIERNPNFDSFYNKCFNNKSNNPVDAHYSELMAYNTEQVKAIIDTKGWKGLFKISDKREQDSKMRLFDLYEKYHSLLDCVALNKLLSNENKQYSYAVQIQNEFNLWVTNSINQLQNATNDSNQKINRLKKQISTKRSEFTNRIKKLFSPDEINQLSISFSDGNRKKSTDDSLYKKESCFFTDISSEIIIGFSKESLGEKFYCSDTYEIIDLFVEIYRYFFTKDNSQNNVYYYNPVTIDLKDDSFIFYVNVNKFPNNSKTSVMYTITYLLTCKLIQQSPWPLQFVCCGDACEEMTFLFDFGCSFGKNPAPILRGLFETLQKREKVMLGKTFFEYNNLQTFEEEDTLPCIIVFMYDFDLEQIKKNVGDEFLNSILFRGSRVGIYFFQISQMGCFFEKGLFWKTDGQNLISWDNKKTISINIQNLTLSSIDNKYGFCQNVIFSDLVDKYNSECESFCENTYDKIICPIGVNAMTKLAIIELSMMHNFWYITGGNYSGKSNTIHVILNRLLSLQSRNPELYIADLQMGGHEYSNDVYKRNQNIKILAFDSDSECIYLLLIDLMKKIRELSDEYRINNVHNWIEYTAKTSKTVPNRVLIIDGIQYLADRMIKNVLQIVSEGIRYNIQVIIAGSEINEIISNCNNVIELGVNKNKKKFSVTRKGLGRLTSENNSETVRFYRFSENNDIQTKEGYTSTHIICGNSFDNPNSLVSAFIGNYFKEDNLDSFAGFLDFGCEIENWKYLSETEPCNISLKKYISHQNVLMVGGNAEQSETIFLHMLYSLLFMKCYNKIPITICLISPTSERIVELYKDFSDLIEVNNFDLTSKNGEVFVIIDNLNVHPELAFHPFGDSVYKVSKEGYFLKSCLESKNIHVITWTDHPFHMHPNFIQGNDISLFSNYFDYRIHLKIQGNTVDFRDLGEYRDCNELSANKAWIWNSGSKRMISLYRAFTDAQTYMIKEKIRSYSC